MSITDSQSALRKAVDFERNGRDYYTQAVEKTLHPVARSVFQLLVEEEDKHLDYLLRLCDYLNANDKWPDEITIHLDTDFKMLFQEELRRIDANVKVSTDEIEALSFAVAMEYKGRAMYMELAGKAANLMEKELFIRLADWEQGHASYLEDYFNYFQDHGLHTEE
jgi:rubrerythrin